MKSGCCVSVDLDRLVGNALSLKSAVGEYYCVLKCDAYGHGAARCARMLYESGMERYAVFSLSEAIAIKPYIGKSEVLILGRTPSDEIELLKRYGFIQTLFSAEYADEIAPYSKGLRVHLKLDTGMNRSGFKCSVEGMKNALFGFAGEIEGAYTHFHNADGKELAITFDQLSVFQSKSRELEALLRRKLCKHAAASAASLRVPCARLDASRIGLALYGILPENCEGTCKVSPVMSVKAPVVSVRKIKKGENIGYGCDQTAENDMTAATLAVGYASGIPRSCAGYFKPVLNGRRVPFVGRICMDRCMVNVTELVNEGITVKPYDEAELLGDLVSAYELANAENTVPYETVTRIGRMNDK